MVSAGKRELAEPEFRNALVLRPDLRGAHYASGNCTWNPAITRKAENEFRAEAQLVPGSATAAFKLGSVLLHRGQLAAAISEFAAQTNSNPDAGDTARIR